MENFELQTSALLEFFQAAHRGDSAAVAELLRQREVEVDVKDEKGNGSWAKARGKTALCYAAANGQVDTCRLLIEEFHANVEAKDDWGWTPLMLATENGHIDTVRLLAEEFNAGLEQRDINLGWTPLIIAAAHGEIETYQFLLQLGANPHARDFSGKTIREIAKKQNQYEMLAILPHSDQSD